jgi:hypothetical protein
MCKNVGLYCKPGGRLVNIRMVDTYAPYLEEEDSKYGIFFTDTQEIPGGTRYVVNYRADPPFSHEGTSMEESASLSNDTNHRYGFDDLSVISLADLPPTKSDAGLWKEFVERPAFIGVTARKNSD